MKHLIYFLNQVFRVGAIKQLTNILQHFLAIYQIGFPCSQTLALRLQQLNLLEQVTFLDVYVRIPEQAPRKILFKLQ
jgi:hypothetical protein